MQDFVALQMLWQMEKRRLPIYGPLCTQPLSARLCAFVVVVRIDISWWMDTSSSMCAGRGDGSATCVQSFLPEADTLKSLRELVPRVRGRPGLYPGCSLARANRDVFHFDEASRWRHGCFYQGMR